MIVSLVSLLQDVSLVNLLQWLDSKQHDSKNRAYRSKRRTNYYLRKETRSFVRIEKLESASFASMYTRRIRRAFDALLIKFSIISRLSHSIDTSSEFVAIKLHKQKINEIVMWNKTFEIFTKCQWWSNITRINYCETQIHYHILCYLSINESRFRSIYRWTFSMIELSEDQRVLNLTVLKKNFEHSRFNSSKRNCLKHNHVTIRNILRRYDQVCLFEVHAKHDSLYFKSMNEKTNEIRT